MARFIIDAPVLNPHFSLAFYCNEDCTSFILGIFVHYHKDDAGYPQLIWSANRNSPVGENSTLEFTLEGDLILRDVNDTSPVWSTNTTGRSVIGLEVTEMGNLALLDADNNSIWQSFDHPTDTLVLGQKLVAGQKLIASASTTSWNEGSQYLTVTSEGLFAFIGSNSPLSYFAKTVHETSYVEFVNGSLSLYVNNSESENPMWQILIPPLSSNLQFMKLDSDGHLKVYAWTTKWEQVHDLFSEVDDCHYPLACGKYGICSNGQCTCPENTEGGKYYFYPVDQRQPNLGCTVSTPLSCELQEYHQILSLNDITYFNVGNDVINTDIENCALACLRNCSCKVSFFSYSDTMSLGECYMESQIFSLINYESHIKHKTKWSVNIKVQTAAIPTDSSLENINRVLLKISLGTSFAVLLITLVTVCLLRKRNVVEKNDSCLDLLSATPMRFSYEELKTATENFCRKLGEGGFGSVYKGTLIDGTKVAVKRLDGLGHVKQSFLAEVETIGSIHHVNLVKLIGFCAEKSNKLLVYEFMCNGSLEKWIFSGKNEVILDWQIRRKIILDIAKGLTYLHEECRQRILHLDIKPQNILLDDKFNAKVADFGLSKLIDKDQSKVMTAMRGTPGYMAPEWLSFVITEKADVYSFGIVLLEILVGKKNLDFTKPKESIHLLGLLETNAEDYGLYNMINSKCDDMKLHTEEVMKMMQLVVWCVQSDFCRRPSMSVVVKVLDDLMDIEPNLDYKFLYNFPSSVSIVCNKVGVIDSSPILPSVLSGPR
ncbi:hypothetical protein AQUCO_05400009v1 [Aquilegia coerulea]|uniref:Receptor-like serine/threonine-protein kinase n=1 Tax=Aquilegia coerulea TaxID=218851 RepID=A0A2G5CH92_AQUCA|nr:hypothetical protein AQUCO_05400009v1 [Aquilegia coerulea]